MLIIERGHKYGLRNIEGSETSVNVDIPIIFSDTKHSRFRQGDREIDSDFAVNLVKQKLPEILETQKSGGLTKDSSLKKFHFNVVDKQSCAVIGCTMETKLNLSQEVVIRTVFFRDQYHPLDRSKSTFFVNEDNPSKEWEDSEYYSDIYKGAYGDFRRYEKQFDPEHPEEKPYRDKAKQEELLWKYRESGGVDRLGGDYGRAKSAAKNNDYEYAKANDMYTPMSKAMNDADNQILTKRGTNGMLRGMDRRSRINKLVREEIRRQLRKYEGI